MHLTQSALKSRFSYDPETGLFARLGGGKRKVGANSGGYIQICIDWQLYYAHRLAWLYMTGKWPSKEIDHANGNPTDNRFCNLREATQQQNNANARLRSDNTHGYKGTYYNKENKNWNARIHFNGRNLHLGCFETKEQAYNRYKVEALKLFGEFARV